LNRQGGQSCGGSVVPDEFIVLEDPADVVLVAGIDTGIISSASRPLSRAATVRRWDRNANASISSRLSA
jgi:hypothetical protein